MKVTVVRADFGTYTQAFKENEYAGIGWFDTDLNDYSNKNEVIEKYKEVYPEHSKGTMYQNVGQIMRFLNEIKEGDVVITPYRTQELLIGIAQSKPYYEKDTTSPYTYRIKVKWNEKLINRTNYSIPLQNTLRSSLTVYNVSQVDEILGSIGKSPTGEEKKIIINSEESIYTQIKNKFLELDATEFELLVSYLLRSLGFEATKETGGVGDGGIDFEGELNVMGVASINLQVQVKRYSSTTIGEKDIRNLRGALKKDYQGAFITLSKFQKKAIESANDPEKTPIKIINGNQFIDVFIEQYEKIIEAMRIDENDELANKLKFKKALLVL